MEKQLLRKISLYIFTSRPVYTSHCVNGKQIGNTMKKVMGSTKKKKVYYNEQPILPTVNSFSKGSFEGKGSGSSRRATVLNKLFMRHITDLMATGDHAQEILGHGIEVNRVKVTPDYQILNVYWIAKGTDNDEVVDKLLKKNAGILRHELSQLRVMGEVPVINFVKDKNYAQITEVENRLAKADFGDDYVVNDSLEKLKSEFKLYMPLESNMKKEIEQLEENILTENDDPPLPPMPQNVLGLNHAEIFLKIKRVMKKSDAPHRKSGENSIAEESWAQFKVDQPINTHPVHLGTEREQRETFKEFLQKRQILKLKKKREGKNYSPDIELIKEELKERYQNSMKFQSFDQTDEDYIIEEFDKDYKNR